MYCSDSTIYCICDTLRWAGCPCSINELLIVNNITTLIVLFRKRAISSRFVLKEVSSWSIASVIRSFVKYVNTTPTLKETHPEKSVKGAWPGA